MPLRFNDGKRHLLVPNVLSRVYCYRPWQGNILMKVPRPSGTVVSIVIDPKKRIAKAWAYIEKRCARLKSCNRYFLSLHERKSLRSILQDVTFTVHELVPKPGAKDHDLPLANSAGAEFALSVWAFLDTDLPGQNSTEALAATILHEIAHYAGATTNVRAKDALQAEKALIHCGLKRFYNPNAKG